MENGIKAAKHRPFSLREVTPGGWYANQLRIQANGLSGHLDTFWPDIKDSKWIGGECEGWERMPYWLDGFIPLAVLCGDEDMLKRAGRYVDAILSRQQEDGWLCPTDTPAERSRYDMWALFLLLKVLVVWEDATGDARVEDAVYRALKSLDRHIDHATLFNWAATRWYECLISIGWLYERRPENWLYDLAIKLRAQGFDWQGFFVNWPMKEPLAQGHWSQMNHVVNNAMMLKAPALIERLSLCADGALGARDMIEQLDTHHGMVTGVFSGDECLAGKSPSQGTELCAVAEYMYSLQHLIGADTDPFFGDRLEKISFNAWPATFDPAMWTHQYVQQVNQMQAAIVEDRIYRTNKPDANTFGLEPDFGCCTANLSQGWPKLSQSVFYQSEDGVSIATWLPIALDAPYRGGRLGIRIDTDYPFRETVTVRLNADVPEAFTLRLRIPAWADGASVCVNGEAVPCQPGEYLALTRNWKNETIALVFPMRARLVQRPNGFASLERGPLVYALKIKEEWKQYNADKPGHELPHGDYEVLPASPWQYGLCVDDASALVFDENAMGSMPFSPEGAPVSVQVPVRPIDWPVERGCAASDPQRTPTGPLALATFIPYGCTCLRMAELPVLSGNSPVSDK